MYGIRSSQNQIQLILAKNLHRIYLIDIRFLHSLFIIALQAKQNGGM